MDSQERNRNALRSQRLIREAYIALAQERGEGRITVADICRAADINRTTFYAHYESLPDLEEKLGQSVLDGFANWLAGELERGGGSPDVFLSDPLPGLERLKPHIEFTIPILEAASKRRLHAGDNFGMEVREALLSATGKLQGARLMRFDFIAAALTNVYFTWMVGAYGNMTLDELNQILAGYIRACAE